MKIKNNLSKVATTVVLASTLAACGSGNKKEEPIVIPELPVVENQAPVLGTLTIADGTFQNGSSIPLNIIVTDDNGPLTVSCSDGTNSVELSNASGNEFTGSLPTTSFGTKDVTCTASDGELSLSSTPVSVDVLPNAEDITSTLRDNCVSDFLEEASQNGLAELGSCFNESTQERIGYTLGSLSSTQEAFNQAPHTLEGTVNPHYVTSVSTSVNGVDISPVGTVFASEELNQTQINENGTTQYNAILATITDNIGTGSVSYSISGDFAMEGKTPEIACDDLTLTADENNVHTLSEETLSANNTFTDLETILLCSQSVSNTSGSDETSSLNGNIRIEYRLVENTAPEVTITSTNYSSTLGDGTPRDIGEVCASITATDPSGIESLVAEVYSVSGTVDPQTMSLNNGQYCASLENLGDESMFIRATATDTIGDSTVIDSPVYAIDKDNAPTIELLGSFDGMELDYNTALKSVMVDLTTPTCLDSEGDLTSVNLYRNGNFLENVNSGSIYSLAYPQNTIQYDTISAECVSLEKTSSSVSKPLDIAVRF